MLDNFLRKLIPRRHRDHIEKSLNQSTRSVNMTVERYTNTTAKIHDALNSKVIQDIKGR